MNNKKIKYLKKTIYDMTSKHRLRVCNGVCGKRIKLRRRRSEIIDKAGPKVKNDDAPKMESENAM
jgi:hypothetical protein